MRKVRLIFLLISVLGLVAVYGVIKPIILRNNSGEMIRFLKHEGYEPSKVIGVNSFTNTVDFKTDKGLVSVRVWRDIYQIVW